MWWSSLGWGLGSGGFSIKCLGYPFIFRAWVTFLSSSIMAMGVEGRFQVRWFKVCTKAGLWTKG